jgi:hypothetical protein
VGCVVIAVERGGDRMTAGGCNEAAVVRGDRMVAVG